MHIAKISCFILLALCLQQCTSIAESAAVLVVATHSKYKEVRDRQFQPTQRCLFKEKPDPFAIAESIAYGNPVTASYQKILNPGAAGEAYQSDPAMPHYVAYAFYTLADRLGDTRAKAKQSWLSLYFERGETDSIKAYMERKYMTSYLEKCFVVPENYKQRPSNRKSSS